MMEMLKLALKNISKRRKRAALTMIGVFIGIAAVVALVALGQGLQGTINAQFEKVGADKLFVQAKEVSFSGESGELGVRDLNVVDRTLGVVQTAGQLFRAGKVEFNGLQRTHFVMSIPDKKKEAKLVSDFSTWEILDGRLISYKDYGKVMVGYNFGYKKPFGENVVVGNKILIEGEVFDVVGVLKRVGDPGIDGGVVVSEEDARRIFDVSESFSYIVAQTVRGVDPDVVAGRVEKALRRDRHLDVGNENFSVTTSSDLIASFNRVLNIIQVVFVGIAMISLLVGGIGIMNTMYTAVLERTNEIGVMKAIGARNSDVLLVFLFESGLLGAVGGGVGILIGVGISKLVEFGANSAFGPGTLVVGIPVWLVVGTLLFSFTVGTVSGILPARRASKLKPVEALRYE